MNSWKAKFGLPFVDDLPLREYIVSEDRFSDGASKQSLLFIWINVMEHIPRNNAAVREMRKQCYKKQTMYIPMSGNKQRH